MYLEIYKIPGNKIIIWNKKIMNIPIKTDGRVYFNVEIDPETATMILKK